MMHPAPLSRWCSRATGWRSLWLTCTPGVTDRSQSNMIKSGLEAGHRPSKPYHCSGLPPGPKSSPRLLANQRPQRREAAWSN